MTKIVILGGCGYIGSKLFTYLSSREYKVDTVDLEWFGNPVNPKNIKKDYGDLSKKFYDKYSVVILLAGHSTVGMCKKDNSGSIKNNVENFINLLNKLDKQKLIYASSYRLYGKVLSIYDLTKLSIDQYASFSNIEYYGLRMATVNGFSPNLRTNQVVNKLFLDAKNKKKITIFDPLAKFTMLGIDDLCGAIEQIIKSKDKRGIYNLGSFDTTTQSLSKEITKLFKGTKVSIKEVSKKAHHITISSGKFQKAFKFTFKDNTESIVNSLNKQLTQESRLINSI